MAITVQMRTEVSQLYVALFGRAPDGEGLGFWTSLRDQGRSLADIANIMYATTPARTYYPSFLTNQEIISAFYTNVLGRTADADGLAFWTGKLNAAGATPGSVIAEMINVVANYTGTNADGLTSQSLFNNRVQVAQYYGEKNGNIAGASTVLGAVTSAAASVTAVKTAIDNGTVGGVNQGQTFALVTGTDTVTGTAGNDTIVGAVDFGGATAAATGSTFTIADVINGGTGTDTLNIAVSNAGGGVALPAANLSSIEVLNLRNVSGQTLTVDASLLTGETQVNADRATSAVTVTNLEAGAAGGMIGDSSVTNGNLTFGYATATSAATLNVTGGTKAGTVVISSTPAAVTVNSTGAANTIGTVALGGAATGLTVNASSNLTTGAITGFTGTAAKITVSGAATSVNLAAIENATVAEVDASGLTAGGLTATGSTNTALKITGGKGNDVITAGSVLTTGTVAAGDGTADRIVVTDSTFIATSALGAKYTGFEVLQVTGGGAAVTQDASLIAGITSIRISDAGNTTGVTNLNATQAGAIKILAGNATGAITIGVKDATVSGNIDTVKLTLDDEATAVGTIALGAISMAGVENVEITALENYSITGLTAATSISSFKSSGAGTAGVTTGAVDFAANSTFDFSGHTAAVTFDASGAQAGATATGLTIKGAGTAANTISDSAKSDVVTGGTKVDAITFQGGADTLTLGAAGDTFTFNSKAGSDAMGTGVTFKVVAADSTVKAGATGAFTAAGAFDAATADAISGVLNAAAFAAAAGTKFTIDSDVTGAAVTFGTSLTFGTTTVGAAGDFFVLDNHTAEANTAYVFQDSNANGKIDATGDLMIKIVGAAQFTATEFAVTGGNLVISTLA